MGTCGRLRMWKSHCTHACTRAATKIPRRELHYILLDYINSVDTRACSRDILHAHAWYVGWTKLRALNVQWACVRRACTRARTQRNIVAMQPAGCVSTIEYRYYWILLSTIIVRYWYSPVTDNWARIESVILERMLLRNLYFSRCKVDPLRRESKRPHKSVFLAYTTETTSFLYSEWNSLSV